MAIAPSTIWTPGTNPVGSISFTYLDGVQLASDVANLYWNQASHILSVNAGADQTGTDSINTYYNNDSYWPYNPVIVPLGANGTTAGYTVSSSRGTGSVPVVSNTGDFIGKFSGWAYSGTIPVYLEIAGINIYAAGTNGSASGLGGEMRFATKGDNTIEVEWIKLTNLGVFTPVSVANPVSLGATTLGWSAFYLAYAANIVPGFAATINQPTGRFIMSAAHSTFLLTNSLVSPTSIVIVTPETIDAVATGVRAVVPGAGFFTLYVNALANANMQFNFLVVNN